MARRSVLASLLAVVALASIGCRHQGPSTAPIGTEGPGLRAIVVSAVDGDTVEVRVGGSLERVRLLGVDTPETVHPDRPVECYGPEASARTRELLPGGTPVLLQRDVQARDRYGRLLAYVWRERDLVFVNEALLAEGAGTLLVIAPNSTRRSQLAAAERRARNTGAGMWGTCPLGDGER